MSRSGLLSEQRTQAEFLMLCVCLDDGRLTAAQLRAIGEAAGRYAHDAATVTGRQNIQLRVRDGDIASVLARLHAAGLTAGPTRGERRAAFLGSPVAGIAADEIVDGTPALAAIRELYAGRAEFSGLPAAFRTAVSGSPRPDVLHEAADISFTGVRHPALGPGFDIRVGGGLSACPVPVGRLGAFAAPREVPDVWAAVVRALRDNGHGHPGGHPTLSALIADWGTGRFRHILQSRYLHRRLADCPPLPVARGPRDHVGVHPQRDGRCYVGLTPVPTVGSPGGAALAAVASLAEAHGSARIRITPYQKLVILDIPPAAVESLCHGLECVGLTARPALSRRRALSHGRALSPARDLWRGGAPEPGPLGHM